MRALACMMCVCARTFGMEFSISPGRLALRSIDIGYVCGCAWLHSPAEGLGHQPLLRVCAVCVPIDTPERQSALAMHCAPRRHRLSAQPASSSSPASSQQRDSATESR